MNQREVDRKRLKLKNDPKLLSPPIVVAPLYQCATSVTVVAFVPHAKVKVEIAGSIVASVTVEFPLPDGVTIPLPSALVAGQTVRARQSTASAQSGWSAGVVVGDHTNDFPAGPPRPEINPAPVFECGSRTGVSNLLTGGEVWITADGTEVGRAKGCKEHQGVNVTPDYGLGQHVRAFFELCKDPSPPSMEHVTIDPPSPLSAPGFDPIFAGGEQLRITNIVNGARVNLSRDGVNQGTFRCWGDALLVGLNPVFASGETFQASQTMCPDDPASVTGTTTVQPCSNLPAPVVGPVQAGDDRITLVKLVPGAVISVYLNGTQVGKGGGPVVLLTKKVADGDTLHVVQDLAGCKGQKAQEVKVLCIDPPVTYDPAGLNLFPVGNLDYAESGVKGSVYYPAEDDGNGQPFHMRWAKLGGAPIVFMAHGNHYKFRDPNNPTDEDCLSHAGWVEIPNHKGYDYFQKQLARMGIIAVSVDCNATNCIDYGPGNIEDRADLIIDSIKHFQSFNGDSSSLFFKTIDFGLTGLMGHSRGGDAVVLVPEVIAVPGVTIKSVIALAPTDTGAATGKPKGHAFMTILPAGDGDVRSNDGAKFYDQAVPGPFKSQLYVHFANHNFFNREWPHDDGVGAPVMSRSDHERVLSAYGCAIFRATLLGHATTGFLSKHQLPANAPTHSVHLSFEREKVLTVDNHEDGNGIGKNTLNQPTTQAPANTADEFAFRQGGGSFNGTFFGNSTGMVIKPGKPNREFRSPLAKKTNVTKSEIWIRVAEVSGGGSVPAGATGFQLGLEDKAGVVAWVDCDEVGGLSRPYERTDVTKTMLETLRFRPACFVSPRKFGLKGIQAILLRCNRRDDRALAFDDLQIVKT